VQIEIRPVSGMDDLERWVAVHNQVRLDDPATTDAKALVRALQTERADLLAYADGVPVGTAVLSGDAASVDSGRPYLQVSVLPAYRGRGIGNALLRAASEEARKFGRTGLSCDVDADDDYSRAFLERRGFVEYRRWERLDLDLAGHEGASPDPPAGVEIASIAERPDLLTGMHGVAAEVYPELGGYIAYFAESFLDWQVYALADSHNLLDLVLLAIADDEVIAFVTARDHDDELAELRMVAVLPAWRGRGVATALVGEQVARAKRTRSGRLSSWVPEGRPAAAVYRALGFERTGGSIEFRGPLL
jgi:GNAT superfamily N-acetyltransferase